MGLFNKKELLRISELEQEIQTLNNTIESIGGKDFLAVSEKIVRLNEEAELKQKNIEKMSEEWNKEEDKKKKRLEELEEQIKKQEALLFDISDEITMQDFGLYKPQYDFMNSEEYADAIKSIREKQKLMIKNKSALNYYDNWFLDGSKSKGRAMNNDNMKMVLRAFNNECDVLIDKVKFNNIDKIEDRICKIATLIDKLNERNKISITQEYIDLKLEELKLVHEYRQKKQEEKEAIRAAREEERELAKMKKEIEDKRKSILKEQLHYSNAKKLYLKQLNTASDEEKILLLEKIDEIEKHLLEIDKNVKEIDYREANQKAGYVYVISNIGAFGENIYKIGMTRRLDPQDRVDELGDASVPFKFDVHAMIFSDDAPKLEAALHEAFADKKVNMINGRKEFFNVSLEEIEKVIRENHDKLVEIKKIADAEQYRESLLIRKNSVNINA